MQLDLLFFALAIPAVLVAGISKGGFGNAAAFAATPILALVVPPGVAIGLMLPLLMVMDIGALRAYWGRWNIAIAKPVMWGAAVGIAVGALVWRVAPADLFRVLIGLVALGFVVFQVARAQGWITLGARVPRPRGGYAWGAVAGLTSFVSHAGGPPVGVHILGHKLDKTTHQATTVLIFTAINLLKVPPYIVLGIFSKETLIADLWLAPVAFLGVWLGVRMHHLVSERAFFSLIYVFLVVTGLKLLWDGLT